MRRRADAGGRHIDLARARLGIGDEFRDRVHRHSRIHFHHIGHLHNAGNRRHVAKEVEGKILIERGVDGVGWIDQVQRVAVRRRMCGEFGAEIVAGAGPVLDDELLMQAFGEILSDQPGDDVGCAARRIADEPPHRMGRIIIVRARGAWNGGRRHAQKCDGDQPPECALHRVLPSLFFSAPMRAYAASAMPHK